MSLVSREELNRLASRAPGQQHDAFSQRALDAAVEEYLARRRAPIARYAIEVDGKPFPSLVAAFLSDTPFDVLVFTPHDEAPQGPAWEYSPRYRRAELRADGSAELVPGRAPADGKALRAIVRLLVREHYLPRPGRTEGESNAIHPLSDLATLPELVRHVRSTGEVPFSLAALLYLNESRVRYEIDLVDGLVLPDLRAGRLSRKRWVRRSSRTAHAIDRYVARGELPVTTARALEVLAETNGLTAVELSQVLGGVRELGSSALKVLEARGLATLDRRTGVYRVRPDAFLPGGGGRSGASPPLPPAANPALRTSVMELMAAADARATCPLCGDPLPAGPSRILCAKCTALVQEGGA